VDQRESDELQALRDLMREGGSDIHVTAYDFEEETGGYNDSVTTIDVVCRRKGVPRRARWTEDCQTLKRVRREVVWEKAPFSESDFTAAKGDGKKRLDTDDRMKTLELERTNKRRPTR